MDANVLTTIIDLGGQGVLLFILSQVWAEQREQNQFIREMLVRLASADDERTTLRQQVEAIKHKLGKDA